MARAEFEAFTKSLLMNYRRSPARADPPLSRCLAVKKVEPGSLADHVLLAQGDLLVSINGQSAGVLSPKLWRRPSKIREYIFYSPATRERIELTAPGLDPGFELGRTSELIKATYKPESRDPEPMMELWQAGAFPALLELGSAALQKSGPDSPILPLVGAALYETGQAGEGMNAVNRYLREFVRGWTTEYRGVALYYLGLDKVRAGETEAALSLLTQAYADVSIDRIADAIAGLGSPRPEPAVLWAGKTAPGDYELQTLEGEQKTVTMSEALLSLGEGRILLVCLLDGYRANGPYNQFMERYSGFVRHFTPFIGPLHVITEIKDRYPDRPHYFETEDRIRAEKAPFELLFDPRGEVGSMYRPTGSPFILALDTNGRILSEGEMEGMELWRALVAANR
jgi:hypothetical protein